MIDNQQPISQTEYNKSTLTRHNPISPMYVEFNLFNSFRLLTISVSPLPNSITPPVVSSTVSHKNAIETLSQLYTTSTSIVSDRTIEVVSRIICYIVSSHLNEGATEALVKDFRTSSVQSPPSNPQLSSAERLCNKIIKFFKFVRDLVHITTAELAHSLNLICSFIQNDSENSSPARPSVINHNTLGTLFLCGIIISLKMNRDHPLKNSFWARTLNIPLPVLNASEIAFLEKIKFSLFLDETGYSELFASIMDLSAS